MRRRVERKLSGCRHNAVGVEGEDGLGMERVFALYDAVCSVSVPPRLVLSQVQGSRIQGWESGRLLLYVPHYGSLGGAILGLRLADVLCGIEK